MLTHELTDALAAAGSGLGAAIAQPGGSSGSSSKGSAWGAAGKRKKGGGGGSPGSGGIPGGPAAAGGEGGHAHADAATAGAAAVADDRYVPHALAACRAYLEGNVVRFLRLYEGAPRMAPYLMDALLAKLRARAYSERCWGCAACAARGPGAAGWGAAAAAARLALLCSQGVPASFLPTTFGFPCPHTHPPTSLAGTALAAFQPSVPLAALSGWFGFSKRKEAAAFLRERGAVVVDGALDVKASRAAAARLAAQAAAAQQQDAARR